MDQTDLEDLFNQSPVVADFVQKTYIAYYGRPADPEGFNHWYDSHQSNIEERESNPNTSIYLEAGLRAFETSVEFSERFSDISTKALINNVYQNLFGEPPEPTTLHTYAYGIDRGYETLQAVVLELIDKTTNEHNPYASAATTVANELTTVFNQLSAHIDPGRFAQFFSDIPLQHDSDGTVSETNLNEIVIGFTQFAEGETTISTLEVQKMYVAYYGRPADPAGMAHWQTLLDRNKTNYTFEGKSQTVTDFFGDSAEYTNYFGDMNNSELVDSMFQRMFGRDADQEGIEYYEQLLNTGEANLVSVALQIADGATGADYTSLQNKILVSNAFTQRVEATDSVYDDSHITAAKELLSQITADIDTAATVVGDFSTVISTLGDEASPSYVTDRLSGTSGDDILVGDSGESWFKPGKGSNIIVASEGSGISYEDSTSAVTVNMTDGIATSEDLTDSFSGITRIRGSEFADEMRRGISNDDSNSSIISYQGGKGDDYIEGGGATQDEINYYDEGGESRIVVSLNTYNTSQIIDTYNNTDTISNIDSFVATINDDVFTVNSSINHWDMFVPVEKTFIGLAGQDTFFGRGFFHVTVDYSRDAVYRNNEGNLGVNGITADLRTGQIIDGYGDIDTAVNINSIIGTAFSDTFLSADSHSITLHGLAGDDLIEGNGNTILDYSLDHMHKSNSGEFGANGIIVDLDTGTIIDGFGNTDSVSNIAKVLGTDYSDTFIGSNGSFFGDGGDDVITGGNGDNWINGGEGNDLLTGGDGKDNFYFGSDLIEGADNIDTITDFTSNEDQLILFDVAEDFSELVINSYENQTIIEYGSNNQIVLTGVLSVSESDIRLDHSYLY
ncbi:DUF4214 domain-containing protein [Motiliproteus sp. MSK22-1]|uniref:DUF4214 domain-containing protein n=1 Tax=Motiliproteus sp. MSK22-1 TaxID=1897630 RepID=UPI001300E471|nr:DUF4214 domain-containing protein [Motiliproteus sp. MSK22-1]